jgi:DUF4097 and DUF4098 domain-containing protein YvlB
MYNKIIMPLAIGLIALTNSILAGDEVNQSLSVDSDGVVQISNVRGIVRVEGWDNNEVSVSGTLDAATEEFKFETSGSVTTVAVKLPRGQIKRGDGSNLIVRVPYGNQVEFEGVSSDFVVESIRAGIDIRTVSGDVDAKDIQEKIYISSVSGDITVKDSSGISKLATVSGDIEARMDSLRVEANAVSGDITLHLKSFERLDMESVSGDLWAKGTQERDGETSSSTVSGNITLNFVDGLNARVRASTGPGGDIRNNISSTEVENIFPNQQRLKCTVGSGDGKVTLSTVSGTISLKDA